jgi:magnesium chelatase family protein
VEHTKLLSRTASAASLAALKRRIATARQAQAERYNSPSTLNTDMTNADIRTYARPDRAGRELLDRIAGQQGLSARAYMKILKLARTIADLEGSQQVKRGHVSEAFQYRPQYTEV